MPCLGQKFAVGASFTVLAGSGVIAVVGSPTVVLSMAGLAGAVGSLLGAISSLISLKECYERHGRTEDAEKMARAIMRLEAQVSDLRTRLA